MKFGKRRYRGANRKELQAALRDRGFYSTEGRLELLALLKKEPTPLSVPAIAGRLGVQLDEVNVYRALEALTRKGALARSDMRRGGAYYEYAHGHHHHIVCNSCGTTEDVENCGARNLESNALKRSAKFSSINTHALEFFGTCRACTEKK